MNFLAHMYLSPPNDFITMGNFFADAVKGKRYLEYPLDIQKGIVLHRAIDTFTDTHPIHKKSRRRLHPRYGHYASVIIDLFYDHILAKNWDQYSDIPLNDYAQNFYKLLHQHYDLLPHKTQQMLPYLERYNWLYNYQFLDGMKGVLEGMNRRTKLKSQMNLALEDLKEHQNEFEEDFTIFFQEAIEFSKTKYLDDF